MNTSRQGVLKDGESRGNVMTCQTTPSTTLRVELGSLERIPQLISNGKPPESRGASVLGWGSRNIGVFFKLGGGGVARPRETTPAGPRMLKDLNLSPFHSSSQHREVLCPRQKAKKEEPNYVWHNF